MPAPPHHSRLTGKLVVGSSLLDGEWNRHAPAVNLEYRARAERYLYGPRGSGGGAVAWIRGARRWLMNFTPVRPGPEGPSLPPWREGKRFDKPRQAPPAERPGTYAAPAGQRPRRRTEAA